jgi:ABC-type glycerol-3-phosphate transport system substrate-binding protein
MSTFLSQIKATPSDTWTDANSPAFTASATSLISETDKIVAGQEDVQTAVENISAAIDKAIKAAGS